MKEMNELIILCVSDVSYLPFVKTLFNSVKCNVKLPYKFHLHTINVSEEEIENFRNEYKNIEFTSDEITLDSGQNNSNPFCKSKKEAYCANIRAMVICDLLKCTNNPILYLDADSIVRGDLIELYKIIKSNDLALFRRDGAAKKNKILTGVIGINNNKTAFEFINYWVNELLKKDNLYKWFSDQIYFYTAMEKFGDEVKISTIPKKFIDVDFLEGAVIWCGKAERKFENEKYIKEMGEYK